MGRYRPPSSLDAALSTTADPKASHPLGARARKSHIGILTVRFEMPFAIWCSTCPSRSPNCLIGQGVRFNAEKKRVGNYFSSPIWSFRMKHTACGGWLEIRTDPKSSEYLVTEGARRRDIGDDILVGERTGGMVLATGPEAEIERARQDAFVALEGKAAAKQQAKTDATRIEELRSLKERDWRDVDAAGRKLRTTFRAGRKARERDALVTESLQDKMSLGIELLAENEGDRRRARLTEFGEVINHTGSAGVTVTTAAKPLFDSVANPHKSMQNTSRSNLLQRQLAGNTRASLDPFAVRTRSASTATRGPSILKTRIAPLEDETRSSSEVHSDYMQQPATQIVEEECMSRRSLGMLVDYTSD